MADIEFSQLVARFARDKGSACELLEAAAGVANMIAVGAGAMIHGTLMETEFRKALGLKAGELVNFRRSAVPQSSQHSED